MEVILYTVGQHLSKESFFLIDSETVKELINRGMSLFARFAPFWYHDKKYSWQKMVAKLCRKPSCIYWLTKDMGLMMKTLWNGNLFSTISNKVRYSICLLLKVRTVLQYISWKLAELTAVGTGGRTWAKFIRTKANILLCE